MGGIKNPPDFIYFGIRTKNPGFANFGVRSNTKSHRVYEIWDSVKLGPRVKIFWGWVKLGPQVCEYWSAEGAPQNIPIAAPIFSKFHIFFSQNGAPKAIPKSGPPFGAQSAVSIRKMEFRTQIRDRIPVPNLGTKSLKNVRP